MEELLKLFGMAMVGVIVGAFLVYCAGRLFGQGFVESLKRFFKHK